MVKLDLRKELKHLYSSSAKEVVELVVPPMSFLMVDGQGDPGSTLAFQEAVEALYAVAYTLKFMVKKGPQAVEYPVMPLEGLWWSDDPEGFDMERRETWKWTQMIMQPEVITAADVAQAVGQVQKTKRLAALVRLRFEVFEEGTAAQVLHVGPYAEEGPAIQRLHRFIQEHGGQPQGKHHEIYLGDPHRTAPDKLKTILRQPFR